MGRTVQYVPANWQEVVGLFCGVILAKGGAETVAFSGGKVLSRIFQRVKFPGSVEQGEVEGRLPFPPQKLKASSPK